MAPDPLADLPPDARVAARKARRWLTGVIWATGVGYTSAWLISRFSAVGWAAFGLAITAQVACFGLWWHYMTVTDREVEKFLAADGVSLDLPAGGGFSGFAKRHPTLLGVAIGVVACGILVLVIFSLDRS